MQRLPGFGVLASSVWSFPASEDPELATAETVGAMCRMIRESLASGWVRTAASEAIAGKSKSREKAEGIFWWVKRHVRFVDDDQLLENSLGRLHELELLIAPERLLTMPQPSGDCDDYTMLVCAMLLTASIPCEIVTVAADARDPSRFSHVYAVAVLPEGKLALDASHGSSPGWEAPAVFRRRTWVPPIPLRRVHLNGLSQVDFSTVDFSTPPFDPYGGGGPTQPSGGGIDWGDLVQESVGNVWDILRARYGNLYPPGTYVQTPGSVVTTAPRGSLLPAAFPATDTRMLLLIGGVGLVLLLVSMGKRK